GFGGRDLPIGLKAPEVVDANNVAVSECLPHALHPPVVSAVADRVPTIKRIAPTLPGLAECVGRHAGDIGRAQVRIQVIKVRMGPHVGAVIADEDGDVADDLDAAAVARPPHRTPLLEEKELDDAEEL